MEDASGELDRFWGEAFREELGRTFTPLKGLVAARPGGPYAPCGGAPNAIGENAFYCAGKDVIAWDAASLVPRLVRAHGELAAAVVMAHEYGHAVQHRLRLPTTGPTAELQADCLAGAWLGWLESGASQRFAANTVSVESLGAVLDGLDELDVPPSGPTATGDRSRALTEGATHGVVACLEEPDSTTR